MMKKKVLVALAVLAFAVLLGCGGGNEDAQADKAAQAEQAAPAATEVAVHDCDGGCGMTDVPVDKMTVVDGKYYCAGCAKHAQEQDHTGHDHDGDGKADHN